MQRRVIADEHNSGSSSSALFVGTLFRSSKDDYSTHALEKKGGGVKKMVLGRYRRAAAAAA